MRACIYIYIYIYNTYIYIINIYKLYIYFVAVLCQEYLSSISVHLDQVFRTSIDPMKEYGFTLKKGLNQKIPRTNYYRYRQRR